MAAANPYTISKPVPYHTDPEFDHAVRFAVDKRDAALMPVISAHASHVRDVADGPGQWEIVTEQAGAQILSSAFPHSNLALQARGALIRSSLRGDGRGRWR